MSVSSSFTSIWYNISAVIKCQMGDSKNKSSKLEYALRVFIIDNHILQCELLAAKGKNWPELDCLTHFFTVTFPLQFTVQKLNTTPHRQLLTL